MLNSGVDKAEAETIKHQNYSSEERVIGHNHVGKDGGCWRIKVLPNLLEICQYVG